MTPQIHRKMFVSKKRALFSTDRVSTPLKHLWEHTFSKEIDGKTFIFRVNLGMWPLKSIVSERKSLVLRVSTHIYGVSKDISGKT